MNLVERVAELETEVQHLKSVLIERQDRYLTVSQVCKIYDTSPTSIAYCYKKGWLTDTKPYKTKAGRVYSQAECDKYFKKRIK